VRGRKNNAHLRYVLLSRGLMSEGKKGKGRRKLSYYFGFMGGEEREKKVVLSGNISLPRGRGGEWKKNLSRRKRKRRKALVTAIAGIMKRERRTSVCFVA